MQASKPPREGQPNRPQRNNNPLNLQKGTGQTGNDGRFAIFPDAETGFQAAIADLTGKMTGQTQTGLNGNSTLTQLINTWSDPTESPDKNANYIANVAQALGVTPNIQIGTLLDRVDELAVAMAQQEGFFAGTQVPEVILRTDPTESLDIVNTLVKQFQGGEQGDNFLKIQNSFARIIASGTDPSPAGDLALIFNFMKVLDPGSVVRESEFATAENTGSIPNRIWARYNKILVGDRLSPPQRNDFLDRAQKLYDAARTGVLPEIERIRNEAEIGGVDPQRVIGAIDQNLKLGTTNASGLGAVTGGSSQNISQEEIARLRSSLQIGEQLAENITTGAIEAVTQQDIQTGNYRVI